jgi:dihydropteroate synthase
MLHEDKRIEFLSHGIQYSLNTPCIMGIVNVTPDSFYSNSRITDQEWKSKIENWIKEGCDILDIGGQSTRPGAARISSEEEWTRVENVIAFIREHFPKQVISIDTFYADVAERAMQMGVHIINDISAFQLDSQLLHVVKKWQVPYVLMHMQGEPQTMQQQPHYEDIIQEIQSFYQEKIKQLPLEHQIWIDPGFGFGKTLDHNLQLLRQLNDLTSLNRPILVGLSRKKTIQQITERDSEHCLAGTIAAQTIALMNGADILRVHDVEEAIQIKKIFREYQKK